MNAGLIGNNNEVDAGEVGERWLEVEVLLVVGWRWLVLDRARERVEGDGGASRADSWVEDRRRPNEEVDTPRMEVISRVSCDRVF